MNNYLRERLLKCGMVLFWLCVCGKWLRRPRSFSIFFFFFLKIFGLTVQHAGSLFPDQGLNLRPLQWKCGVLTIGLPGSPCIWFFFCNFYLSSFYLCAKGFPGDSVVKNLTSKQETQVWSWGQEDPLEKEMASSPGFLPGKSHGQEPGRL